MNSELNHPSLKDRVILITGGSRGLGWAMGEGLLKAGANIVITGARSLEDLSNAQSKAEKLAGSDHVLTLQADVTQWQDCESVVEKTLARFGTLHVLINNAARGPIEIDPNFVQRRPRFWEAPVDGWRTIFDANVNGSFLMARAVAPHFIEQGFGKIINISTALSNMVHQGSSPYGSSKAAIEAATMSWAKDLDGTGVTVNVIEPGGGADTALIPGGVIGERASRLLSPSVMVPPALWLCSDLSNDTTAKRYIGKNWHPDAPIAEGKAQAQCPSHDYPAIM